MPNIIPVDVPNPDELRNIGAYGTAALVRVQGAATSGGAYANLTGTGATPTIALEDALETYTAFDPEPVAGDATWYRSRYESGDGLRLGTWTTPRQVGPLAFVTAASIIAHVKGAGYAPNADELAWAGVCADAIEALIAHRMADADLTAAAVSELRRAGLQDGAAAYIARKAPHGIMDVGDAGNTVRLGRDIGRALVPVFLRYAGPGIG